MNRDRIEMLILTDSVAFKKFYETLVKVSSVKKNEDFELFKDILKSNLVYKLGVSIEEAERVVNMLDHDVYSALLEITMLAHSYLRRNNYEMSSLQE
ncbi:MAG: hypothetical protein QXE98_05625 [Archaeoglobaceae archaeon]